MNAKAKTPELARRPRTHKSGVARVVYNVLHDMYPERLRADQIYDLMPSQLKGKPYIKKKVRNALSNGVRDGWVMREEGKGGNKPTHKYWIASADHREVILSAKRNARRKSNGASAPAPRQPKLEKETLIDAINAEIKETEARLATLQQMRRDARTL